MKKQVLSLALSATMLASMLPKPAFAADNTSTFPDMPSDWSTQALQNAVNNGLLNGIDGKIAAGENLTRAQMAAIVTRAFGTNGKANISSFGDVNAGDWFYDAMASSVLMGAFQGDGVNLNPNANITRQEAFTVLARLFTLSGGDQSVLSRYTDGAQVADWAKDSMASMVAAGYVKGSDNMLNPQSSITRAEFAQVMDNLVKTYFADSRLNVNANGNAVLNKAGTLEGATISGDLIIGDGAAEGDVVLKNVTVSGRLLVRGGGTSTVTLEGNTTVGSVAVNKPTGAVRVKNNTQKTVNVNALSDNVVLTGGFNEVNANASQGTVTLTGATVATMNVAGTSAKVVVSEKSTVETMNVQGSASGAAVSVQSGTNVKTMNTAASKAVVTVNGTVNTMSVAGSDTTVKAEEGAKIEKITTSAAKTTVSGKGSVANFEAAKGSSGADLTTDGTKVVNNGTGNVTTGNDKVIASGSTGASKSDSTTPGGGGSTSDDGGSVVVSSDVIAATVEDHDAAHPIAKGSLYSSYSVSGTVQGGVNNITITAKDLMKHDNASGAEGYWVGFGVPQVTGNVYYTGWGSVPESLGGTSSPDNTMEQNGKTYDTFYWGTNFDNFAKGGYLVVKNGDKTTTYNITFDVTKYQADVSVLTDIQVRPEEDSHKTAAALGLTAVPTGTTVTLSGTTTTDKLEATGAAKQNVYLLYVFNVKSELIKQLGGTVTPDPVSLKNLKEGGKVDGAGSMNNAALLNIQIWDKDKSSFIKKTISMDLKDAAGRVQDTVKLTVDATGCKIAGQHSVTFKDAVDGKAIESISVKDNGTVTPPSNPSKEGFKFLGWYSDENTEFTAGTQVTADMTVYAKWEKIPASEGDTLPSADDWKLIPSFTLNKDYKLTEAYEVPTGKTLVIAENVTLTVGADKTLTVNGTISGEDAVKGTDVTLNKETVPTFSKLVKDGKTKVWANDGWFEVTEQTAETRGNGPAKDGTPDFPYGNTYTSAGVTFADNAIKVTVATTKNFLGSEANKTAIENLTQPSGELNPNGNVNGLFFGVQFEATGSAKKVTVYRSTGGAAAKNLGQNNDAFDLTKETVYGGADTHDGKFINYLVFAKADAEAEYIGDNTWSYTFVWQNADGGVIGVSQSTITRASAK